MSDMLSQTGAAQTRAPSRKFRAATAESLPARLALIFLALMFLSFVLLEGLFGATLGKWVLGLRVVGITGGKPGLARSALRNLLRLVDGLPAFNLLGIFLIQRSPEKARFGDRIAQTRVIHSR